MYLIYDTETTGFLKGKNLDNPTQPHVVQLGAALLDESGTLLDTLNLIAKPNGYEIPTSSANVHGITTEIAEEKGVPLKEIFESFNELVNKAELGVCHNVDFDKTIMLANYHKLKMHEGDGEEYINFCALKSFCTMRSKSVIDYCALPPTQKMRNAGRHHYKTPNLTELHIKCFGVDFDGAHDAFEDVKATANVFFHLKRSGIISR